MGNRTTISAETTTRDNPNSPQVDEGVVNDGGQGVSLSAEGHLPEGETSKPCRTPERPGNWRWQVLPKVQETPRAGNKASGWCRHEE